MARIAKESGAAKLIQAIRDAVPLDAALPAAGTRGFATRRPLTPRELQIFELLIEGETSRGIAGKLGLSLKTIEAHKFNLMRKLDVHSRSQLINLAIRRQLTSYRTDGGTDF
jgi:DNA-binding NarL/FixJ family response regulator